jgi:hypothetical protein
LGDSTLALYINTLRKKIIFETYDFKNLDSNDGVKSLTKEFDYTDELFLFKKVYIYFGYSFDLK